MFELLHGWVGLLVEANPLAFVIQPVKAIYIKSYITRCLSCSTVGLAFWSRKTCICHYTSQSYEYKIIYYKVFELLHGWVGLLVEANPLAFAPSFSTGRKTWQVVIIMMTMRVMMMIIMMMEENLAGDQQCYQSITSPSPSPSSSFFASFFS